MVIPAMKCHIYIYSGRQKYQFNHSFCHFADNLPNDEDQPLPPPPNPIANTDAQQDIQLEILRVLQEIHLNYATGRGVRDVRGGRGGRGLRGQGNCNRNRRTSDNTNLARHITDQYCSTYGGFNHAS